MGGVALRSSSEESSGLINDLQHVVPVVQGRTVTCGAMLRQLRKAIPVLFRSEFSESSACIALAKNLTQEIDVIPRTVVRRPRINPVSRAINLCARHARSVVGDLGADGSRR